MFINPLTPGGAPLTSKIRLNESPRVNVSELNKELKCILNQVFLPRD